ncbi:hypothetical protein K7432_009796, partial [Basidiobolus ranarum]
IRVKYQIGPSVEAEGEQTASVYSKHRGGEHSFNPIGGYEQFGQVMPDTQLTPMQSEQYDSSTQPEDEDEEE